MTYYILLGTDSIDDVWDENVLGEESFGKFYVGGGYKALTNMISRKPEVLESISIVDEKKNPYSVEEFLELLTNWKIILDN